MGFFGDFMAVDVMRVVGFFRDFMAMDLMRVVGFFGGILWQWM